MIAKISTADSLRDVMHYNLNKVEKEQAVILYGNEIPFHSNDNPNNYSMNELMDMFAENLQANQREGRTKKPIVHISLNPDPDDKISNDDYAYMAKYYLNQMGFENQPFVIFKHEDIDRRHIHIVTTNVKLDGSKINDKFNHRQSQKICEKIEQDWELRPAKFAKRKSLQNEQYEQKYSFTKQYLFDAEKGDTGRQIRQVVHLSLEKYHFETDKEYRALLRLFGVEADFKDAQENAKQGIVFYGLDNDGNRVTKPMRSFLIQKGLSKKIENKFEKSKKLLSNFNVKNTIKTKLDCVKTATSKVDFYEKLSEQNLDIIFRQNETGRIYGATVIDHDSGVVQNGSKFGKAYSANVFNDLFISFDSGNIGGRTFEPAKQQEHHSELVATHLVDSENTIIGSSGSWGHYERVGDKEESENDKLNRKIKKRKTKKTNL